ncbi:glucose-6-phosphate exchanger SLC37A4-like isoform X2 [Dermacentor andersoni]|uniref:glucose-6-phosphate exchanger SLC37A4-like isoform X2 n=1 Tax=Dermacentor andersoni TaxID=34620 RepID=UPI003B3AF273
MSLSDNVIFFSSQWFLQAQFGTLYGVLSASANISLSVAPFLSSYLMLTYNWRVSVGFTDAALKTTTTREQQEEELTCSAATPVNLLSSPFIWLLSGSYLTLFFARTGAADWGQIYIIEDLKQTQFAANSFMSCIEGGGFLGGILAGYITDWMIIWHTNKGGTRGANPRVPVSVVLTAGAAVAFHIFSYSITEHSSELLIGVIGLALGGCLYGAMAIFGVVASECVPAHLSGTSHAIVAFGGSLGGVISGFPLSLVAEHYSWSAVFLLLEIISFLTAFALFAGMNFDSRVRAPAAKKDVAVVVAVPVPALVDADRPDTLPTEKQPSALDEPS